MQNIRIFFLFGTILVLAAPNSSSPIEEKHYQDCVVGNLIIKHKEEANSPQKCGLIFCSNGKVTEASCSPLPPIFGLSAIADCKLTEYDLSKKFPECCPRPICTMFNFTKEKTM